MRSILLVIGVATALVGGLMCLHILGTGEGNPIPALLTLVAGIVLSVPGYRWAQRQDWPRQ